MSSWNPFTARLASLPAYVVVGVDGYRHLLTQLEEAMDEKIDVALLMTELIEAIRIQRTALEDIEYHCLGLLEEHRFGNLYHQFEPLVDYVNYVGKELYRTLCENGAYHDGELPYQVCRVRPNGVYFKRKDLFQQEVQRELDIEHAQTPPWLSPGLERVFRRGTLDARHPLSYRATDPGLGE